MSLSRPQLQNPAEHRFEWRGGEGSVQFYDREKKERIKVPIPFEFIVLDELATVTGYDKLHKSGIWSNEVRSTVREPFTVRDKGSIRAQGYWQEVKDKNHNFTCSVYIAHPNKAGELILGKIYFTGSSLGPWIDFKKAHVVGNGKIKITGSVEDTSGTTPFYRPVFAYDHMSTEEYQAALELDKTLQTYLDQYLAAPADEPPAEEDVDQTVGQVSQEELARLQDAPVPKNTIRPDALDKVHAANPMNPADPVSIEDLGGEPINIDDIPF